MAAISSVLFSFLRPGDKVLVHKTIYGSSYNVVTKVLPKYEIDYTIADLAQPESLESSSRGLKTSPGMKLRNRRWTATGPS
jgi:methionine-gamma-lyase